MRPAARRAGKPEGVRARPEQGDRERVAVLEVDEEVAVAVGDADAGDGRTGRGEFLEDVRRVALLTTCAFGSEEERESRVAERAERPRGAVGEREREREFAAALRPHVGEARAGERGVPVGGEGAEREPVHRPKIAARLAADGHPLDVGGEKHA